MKVKAFIIAACASFTFCTTPKTQEAQQTPVSQKEKPNVVLIYCDDMGYADIASFGGEVATPNIDQLGDEGATFTNFHTASSVCTPSRAALMTGRYPARFGMADAVAFPAGFWDKLKVDMPQMAHMLPDEDLNLPYGEATMAQVLKQNEYETGIFGKWHLGSDIEHGPMRYGFDTFWGTLFSNDMWPANIEGLLAKYHIPLAIYEQEQAVEYNPNQNTLTRDETDQAVKFIKTNKDKPFFCYVPFSMPHVPIGASDAFRGKSGKGLYGDCIMELDYSVGRITKELKTLGLEDNTMVIFSSDNGPWLIFGEHSGSAGKLKEGKQSNYEGGFRTPFIAKLPGVIPAGLESDEVITNLDILPTVMDIIDNTFLGHHKLDGENIIEVLKGNAKSPYNEKAFFYCDFAKQGVVAAIKGDYKLILPHTFMSPFEGGKDGWKGKDKRTQVELGLYNIKSDVGEHINVADQHPEIVADLKAEIEKFSATLPKAKKGMPIKK